MASHQNQSRRGFLATTSTLVCLGLAGCTEDDDDDGDDPSPTPSPTPGEDPTPTPEETPTPDEDTPTPESTPEPGTLVSLQTVSLEEWDPGVETITGTGPTVTDEFSLASVATAVIFSHDGESNFAIHWLDDDGDTVELVVNEIGAIEGARVMGTPEHGDYRFDIEADGAWELTVLQPFAPPEHEYGLPADAAGTGHDVVGVVALEGDQVISATHDGESNFIVHLIDEESSGGFDDTELVINEIGEFDGETHSTFEGYAFVGIQADGDWTIEIE